MAQEGAAGNANPMANFLPIIMIFGIVYFLMIRPQKKQLEDEKSMMSA
ncbi:unnamed protein product, partial [Chrysoparadoxa australica]